MSEHDRLKLRQSFAHMPVDLPMPPYRFQRENRELAAESGTAKQATDILREANLLGCFAASAPTT